MVSTHFPGFKVLKRLHEQNEGSRHLASRTPSARPLLPSANHGIVVCYQESTLSSGVCAFHVSLNAALGLFPSFLIFVLCPHPAPEETQMSGVCFIPKCHSQLLIGPVGLCFLPSPSSLAEGMIRVMKTLRGLSLLSPRSPLHRSMGALSLQRPNLKPIRPWPLLSAGSCTISTLTLLEIL